MIKEIKKNIWQITFRFFGSTVYLVRLREKNILIDTSSFINRLELKSSLKNLNLIPEDIDVVLLTHNHFDHTGNIKIFKNAKVYGSKEDFGKKILNTAFALGTDEDLPESERNVEGMFDLEKFDLKEFRVIEVPGHTKGSVVFYMPKEKVLFSGDHIFLNGYIGRTDLPNSEPEKMKESLEKMKKLNYEILCPGHEY